ncbi:MAG: CoA transferase [Dehalococcoidia bacterium]
MPALDGMRILDMTQYEAGTSCTQALAWLGADVVKVEQPGRGDPGRRVRGGGDDSPYFLNWNSNKRSITIDLSCERGRELFLSLVPKYHVFVENYGPGVVEKLDIGYDALRKVHPSIIYGRVKGFGSSGPYSGYKCYDMIAQAAGAAFSVTGESEGPPMRPGATMGDAGAGLQMALAITAAYVQQQRTGEGQCIDLSMQEAVTMFMRTQVANAADWGRQAAPRNGNAAGAPTDLYPCKPFGPNDFLYIMVVTTRMWDTLCAAIDRPDLLMDPRFETGRARVEHRDELHAEIAKWTRAHDKHQAMRLLGEAGVPCSYTFDTTDLWTDPHLKARGLIEQVNHPTQGAVDLMRSPVLMTGSQVPMVAAPLLGQHTDEVLNADLGLDPTDLEGLRTAGAIG